MVYTLLFQVFVLQMPEKVEYIPYVKQNYIFLNITK